jgi:hypothetical protein
MKEYRIYIRSNEHPRTINTPMMGRTYYTLITVHGKDALIAKVTELRNAGEHINEIRTGLGTRIWL